MYPYVDLVIMIIIVTFILSYFLEDSGPHLLHISYLILKRIVILFPVKENTNAERQIKLSKVTQVSEGMKDSWRSCCITLSSIPMFYSVPHCHCRDGCGA